MSISATDKLAIVEELESTGLSSFWATDAEGRIVYLSPAILEGLARDPELISGKPLQTVFVPVGGDGDSRSLGLKLGTRKSFANLTVRGAADDQEIVLRIAGRPLFAAEGQFLGFRGSGIDITEEHRSEEEASRLAKFDSLTGLANRHRMAQMIDSTLAAFRSAKRSCALMMLDLDRFKQVNDTLGHAAGDQLLQQVAERLRSVLGGRGEIGRLGGDEFQVLISDLDDRGELGEIAKKIITMISQPYSVEEGRCTIGCSIGIAIAPYDGVERDELTRAADLALYASKNGGRGQFRFYAADLEHDANLRRRMEEDLGEAIEAGSFSLAYQPIVSLKGNRVVALEAQYRWDDEERGYVAPETFLPVAEGSRLIIPIGEWALREICREAAGWPASLRVAIAVSPVQFGAAGFVAMVADAIEQSGLDAGRLELELDEAIVQGDPSAVDAAISGLFKLGVRLTLGRFGMGFTSLSYLRRAPFAALKIGENFFERSAHNDESAMDVVRAIVALGDAVGMETAATGVHAIELFDRLKEQGVDEVQGMVFSEAISADEVSSQIEDGDWTLAPTDAGFQRASRRTVLRRIGVIHEDHYYDVTLRNLSRSGAMIQGLDGVPVDTQFVLDFGGGQLAVASVRRSMNDIQGVEFEAELVDDGAGGLCTRHSVSPYELAAAGAPLTALPPGKYSAATLQGEQRVTIPQFNLSANAPTQSGPRSK